MKIFFLLIISIIIFFVVQHEYKQESEDGFYHQTLKDVKDTTNLVKSVSENAVEEAISKGSKIERSKFLLKSDFCKSFKHVPEEKKMIFSECMNKHSLKIKKSWKTNEGNTAIEFGVIREGKDIFQSVRAEFYDTFDELSIKKSCTGHEVDFMFPLDNMNYIMQQRKEMEKGKTVDKETLKNLHESCMF